jgi:hypothetical protein
VVAELRRIGQRIASAEAAAEVDRGVDAAIRLVDAQVFGRGRAFARGFLHGGAVDDFFRRSLPKLELVEDTVYHALHRDAPDLDREVGEQLAVAALAALGGLADRLDHLANLADAGAFDLEVGVARALEATDARRRSLVP